jgi:SAM-dependent methyltransferase
MPPGGSARSSFWTDRTVAWYRRAAERGDYGERVLEAIGSRLDGCRDALDVGAGCGALSIPLARRLERVTALEPTRTMADGLQAWAREAGLANITVVEAAWGEVQVAPHDLVLCAHVGGLLRGDSPFLREVGRVARRLVVLVRDAPATQRDDKFFFSELYPALLGRPYEHRCDAEETLAAIRTLGITPAVTPIDYVSDQPFTDLEEACDFWMIYMGLEGVASRAYLRRFLAERLTRHGDEWVAPYRKSALVLAWEPNRAARSTRRR